jgi:predicted nucleic acid-binding protein
MTRFAVDAPTALRLLEAGLGAPPEHQLVGTASLRSEVSRLLFVRSLSGRLTPGQARELLDALASLKLRLLGDRVSRATSWSLADQLGWHDPTDAEILAVARLQADTLVTGSARLLQAAAELGQAVTDPEELLGLLAVPTIA